MVLVGYNKEQHVLLINFKYMTILLKRGVLVALTPSSIITSLKMLVASMSVLKGRNHTQLQNTRQYGKRCVAGFVKSEKHNLSEKKNQSMEIFPEIYS